MRYLAHIRSVTGLPVYYEQFDLKSGNLIEESA